jgi:hypothetical protein
MKSLAATVSPAAALAAHAKAVSGIDISKQTVDHALDLPAGQRPIRGRLVHTVSVQG